MFIERLVEVQYDVLYGCTIAFMVTSTVAVALRMYVRSFILKKIGYDDWALVLALVSQLALLTCCTDRACTDKNQAMFFIDCGVSIALYQRREYLYHVLAGQSSPDVLDHYIMVSIFLPIQVRMTDSRVA